MLIVAIIEWRRGIRLTKWYSAKMRIPDAEESERDLDHRRVPVLDRFAGDVHYVWIAGAGCTAVATGDFSWRLVSSCLCCWFCPQCINAILGKDGLILYYGVGLASRISSHQLMG